jgi:hypothetical protein
LFDVALRVYAGLVGHGGQGHDLVAPDDGHGKEVFDGQWRMVSDVFRGLPARQGCIASGRKERPALWGRQSQFFGRLGGMFLTS